MAGKQRLVVFTCKFRLLKLLIRKAQRKKRFGNQRRFGQLLILRQLIVKSHGPFGIAKARLGFPSIKNRPIHRWTIRVLFQKRCEYLRGFCQGSFGLLLRVAPQLDQAPTEVDQCLFLLLEILVLERFAKRSNRIGIIRWRLLLIAKTQVITRTGCQGVARKLLDEPLPLLEGQGIGAIVLGVGRVGKQRSDSLLSLLLFAHFANRSRGLRSTRLRSPRCLQTRLGRLWTRLARLARIGGLPGGRLTVLR